MVKEDTYKQRITQAAIENGYVFVGWFGQYIKSQTECLMECSLHGEWIFRTLDELPRKKIIYCPGCWLEFNRKSDSEMTNIFLQNKVFHPDTKFWRSDRLNSEGKRTYWWVDCPECGQVNEANASGLRKGSMPCTCGRHKQTYAYIHTFYLNGSPLFLKYGVTNDPQRRLEEHIRNNKMVVDCAGIWKFPSKTVCYEAERRCRKELTHCVIEASILSDGKTEAVVLGEHNKIQQIYEECGGSLLTKKDGNIII